MHPLASEHGPLLLEREGTSRNGTDLIDRLETTRRGMERFQRTRWLLRGALVVLAGAGLLAGADWLWVLGERIRIAGLLALGVVAGVFVVRALMAPRRHCNRQEVAAEVETAFPQLGQRVRTTLQYREPAADTAPAAAELVDALASDTMQRTRGLDFRGLVPWGSLASLGVGLFLLAALSGGLLVDNEEARIAALRLFLLPASYTHLEVKPGDHTMKAGADVSIEATVSGRAVPNVELQHRPWGSADEWTRVSLADPDEAADRPQRLLGAFSTTLKSCEQDLEYRVVAGPIESAVYRLHILHPLVLKGFQAGIEPPAYTRRPPQKTKERDFKVIAGSAVRVHIALDRQPQRAELLLHPLAAAGKPAEAARQIPLEIQGADLTGTLPGIDREAEVEIVAEAEDGMKLEGEHFRIRVQPDGKPTVRFVKPAETTEVTPSTEVHVRVEAGDDFGLSKVGIVYQIGNGPKKTLLLKQDSRQPTRLVLDPVLALEEHKVSFQDGVSYYAFAEDNHPTRPQRTTTDLQFIDIRPYKRAYQMLKTGGS